MTATVKHDTAQSGEVHLTLYAERAVIVVASWSRHRWRSR